MTQITRLTNLHLLHRKQAEAPKVAGWLTWVHNVTAVNLVLLVLFVVYGVSYLAIVNSTAADTFRMYQLTARIQTTQEANQRLELDMSEVLSLPHVNEMSRQYNLVTATNVHYLNATPAVALSQ